MNQKRGRPTLDQKDKKRQLTVTVSRPAYLNFLAMPKGYRSVRISNFLERLDTKIRVEEAGSKTGHPDARDPYGNKYETETNIQKEETNE